jgi:hypothetical protein
MFSFHDLIDIVPSGTLGVWGARFALKQSGSFGKEPGVWQAVALWIGAHLTGSIVGSMFGSTKGLYAKIGALSYGGDMFARTRLFQNSDWIEKNLSLAGDDDEGYSDEALMEGFQPASALGDDGEDRGWALAGMGAPGEIVRDGQGNLYQLSGGMGLDSGPGSGSRLAGFQQASALGGMRANPNSNSSFGYSP